MGVNRGRLIVFEGVDGGGKSTQLRLLAERVRERGLAHVVTGEPTDGVWGRRIRAMARAGLHHSRKSCAFAEDRREHVAAVLRPGLQRARSCSRIATTCRRSPIRRGLDPQTLLAQAEAEFPLPDLALIFELDPDAGLARVQARGDAAEPTFEEAGFLARVAAVFRALDRPYLARIDASGPIETVARAVRETVRERLAIQ
jgi:dTMP kinase